MRIYRADNNLGCIFGLIFMFVFFNILFFFGRLLFTTPLGLALVVTFGIWYWYEARRRTRRTGGGMYEFHAEEPQQERENPFEESGNGFNRQEAVDVTHYEDVKDDE